ncbi:Smg-4/UPF3 family-domain-containing protein [Schizophyllum commune]
MSDKPDHPSSTPTPATSPHKRTRPPRDKKDRDRDGQRETNRDRKDADRERKDVDRDQDKRDRTQEKSDRAQEKADRDREKLERKKERAKAAQAAAEKQKLKIVVRRLPPNLPEAIFWESVQAWVSEETVSWRTYWPGKIRSRPDKENVPSRAYIVFKTDDQVATFGKEYDGHLFRDKAGNEFQAVVEFAPYQKVPSEKKKVDVRAGTIEKDEDYISFLESLNAPTSSEPVTMESLLAATRPPSPPKTTPLLEYLKFEKENNATRHRDVTGIIKKDKKEKGRAPPPPPPPGSDAKKKKAPPLKAPAAATATQEAKAARRAHKAKPSTSVNTGVPPSAGASSAAPQSSAGPSSSTVSPSDANAPLPTGSTKPPPAGPGAAARKSRPALGMSRGFEAALSGAMGGGGPRSKREPPEGKSAAAPKADAAPKEGPPPAEAPKVPGLISASALAGVSEAPKFGGDSGRGPILNRANAPSLATPVARHPRPTTHVQGMLLASWPDVCRGRSLPGSPLQRQTGRSSAMYWPRILIGPIVRVFQRDEVM